MGFVLVVFRFWLVVFRGGFGVLGVFLLFCLGFLKIYAGLSNFGGKYGQKADVRKGI